MNRSNHKLATTGRKLGAALLLAAAALAGCRREQMGDGSYQKPFRPTNFFADHNSTRPLVEGTVSRPSLILTADERVGLQRPGSVSDVYGYDRSVVSTVAELANKVDADFPADFPREGDALRRRLERGQERYNIYCAVCHGQTGAGDGMIVQRGFIKPPAFYPIASHATVQPDLFKREQNLLTVPPGYVVDKITNGYGAMYSYAARVNLDDRWNIAAYFKVLQASQSVAAAELSEADRSAMKMSASGDAKATEAMTHEGNPTAKPSATSLPVVPATTTPATTAATTTRATTQPAPEGQR